MSTSPKVKLANYCACFLDLLGQKKAMEGQSVLPAAGSPEEREGLINLVKASVGKIVSVQKHAESMLGALQGPRMPPGPLDQAQLKLWDRLRQQDVVTQRWSDGLMILRA